MAISSLLLQCWLHNILGGKCFFFLQRWHITKLVSLSHVHTAITELNWKLIQSTEQFSSFMAMWMLCHCFACTVLHLRFAQYNFEILIWTFIASVLRQVAYDIRQFTLSIHESIFTITQNALIFQHPQTSRQRLFPGTSTGGTAPFSTHPSTKFWIRPWHKHMLLHISIITGKYLWLATKISTADIL